VTPELSYWCQVHKTTKDPVSVMMLRIGASDRKNMPPVSLPASVKVNLEDYLDILSSRVKQWVEADYPDRNYLFRHDRASQKVLRSDLG
jgi:hypothetical protein